MFLIGNAKHRAYSRSLCTLGVKPMKTTTQNQSPAINAIVAMSTPAIAPRDSSSKGTATAAKKTAPKLAEKLAQAAAPVTKAMKAKAAAKAAAPKVEMLVTDPHNLNQNTEAYKLFSGIKKQNEKIYAFFAANVDTLFKTTASGVQLDAANAYKKFFDVSHTRGAPTPLKEYDLYKEFTNALAYWVRVKSGIKTSKNPKGSGETNAIYNYLKPRQDDPQVLPALKSFIAGAFTKAQWDALRAQLDAAFAGTAVRKVSKVKSAA